jgi:hypothetical protein
LGCDPEYRDWATDLANPGPGQPPVPGLLFITSDVLPPSSTLSVTVIADASACGPTAATANTCSAASTVLTLGTAKWGDITSVAFGPPDGKSDVLDIPAVKNKLLGVPTFFSEPRTWLKQRDPAANIDAITVVDLSDVVDGVLAKPYPPPTVPSTLARSESSAPGAVLDRERRSDFRLPKSRRFCGRVLPVALGPVLPCGMRGSRQTLEDRVGLRRSCPRVRTFAPS